MSAWLQPTHDHRHESPAEAALAFDRLAIAPHYAVIRRAIGFLSGLVLLYRSAHDFRPEEIQEGLNNFHPEFDEAVDGLRSAKLPEALTATRDRVLAAAGQVALAASTIRSSLTATGGGLETAERSLEMLRRAHRILLPIHDQHSGMMMVDFNHACCHCAAPHHD